LSPKGRTTNLVFVSQILFSLTVNLLILLPSLIIIAILLQGLFFVLENFDLVIFEPYGVSTEAVLLFFIGLVVICTLLYSIAVGRHPVSKDESDIFAASLAHVYLWLFVIIVLIWIFICIQDRAMDVLFRLHDVLVSVITSPKQFYSWLLGILSFAGVVAGFTRTFLKAFAPVIARSWRVVIAIATPIMLWAVVLIIEATIRHPTWLSTIEDGLQVNVREPIDYVICKLWPAICVDSDWDTNGVKSAGEITDVLVVVVSYMIFAFVIFVLTLMININKTSLHSRYRERLDRAYVLRRNVKLSELSTLTPYQIINSAINIQGSSTNLRGRDADTFIMSRNYCGGELTKYYRTDLLENLDPNFNLATAVAISGAAISPNQGYRTNRLLRLLMGLANMRLGYWFINPMQVPAKRKGAKGNRHSVSPYYFLLELVGKLDENKKNVYLTDGDHFDNLRLYELLKRKCKFIVVVDAEQDARSTFHGLAHVASLARIDFGYEINISVARLQPDQSLFSQDHVTFGQIRYSENESGQLVYIKNTITGGEDIYIHEYRSRSATFPHETTADQFFTEEQYEAYRALGFHIGYRLTKGKSWESIAAFVEDVRVYCARYNVPFAGAASAAPAAPGSQEVVAATAAD